MTFALLAMAACVVVLMVQMIYLRKKYYVHGYKQAKADTLVGLVHQQLTVDRTKTGYQYRVHALRDAADALEKLHKNKVKELEKTPAWKM